MIRKALHSLLPEYANNTLSPVKRQLVAWWLKRDAAARAELHALQHLREAMQAQPIAFPSPEVFRSLQTRIHTLAKNPPAAARSERGFWRAWAGGMGLIFLSLILLWNALPPGIVLQWSAEGGQPVAFRIYRATASDQPGDFELVREMSARKDSATPDSHTYTFRDFLLLPGQEYVYRVEVIDQNGLSTSQTIISDAMEALPGQLATLLATVIIGYGLSQAIRTYLLDTSGRKISEV
jgi:hypothetical protein